MAWWYFTKNEVFHYGSLQWMWPNPQVTADLVTFTEEIRNGKLHFFCACEFHRLVQELKLGLCRKDTEDKSITSSARVSSFCKSSTFILYISKSLFIFHKLNIKQKNKCSKYSQEDWRFSLKFKCERFERFRRFERTGIFKFLNFKREILMDFNWT